MFNTFFFIKIILINILYITILLYNKINELNHKS